MKKYDILHTDHKPCMLTYYVVCARQEWQSHVNPFHLSATHLAPEQEDGSGSATTDSESDLESGITSPIPGQLSDPANHSVINMYIPSSKLR